MATSRLTSSPATQKLVSVIAYSNADVFTAQPFSITFSDTPSTLMVKSSVPIPQKGLGTSVISVIQLSFRYR
jgi:hypothetical protein